MTPASPTPPTWSDSWLTSLLESLPADQLRAAYEVIRPAAVWVPNPGPQGLAYLSDADDLYYGGAAGGGKTQLVIGLSLSAHRNTLFLRRQQVDTKAISEVYRALPASVGRWKSVGYGGEFRTTDGRLIEVGGCQHEDDWKKYAGHAHDLKAFDELPQFSKRQFTTLIAWNRVREPHRFPGQRCRTVGAGNPPTDAQGEWVLQYWAPWLDPEAGRKARPGELRWYVRVDGEDDEKPVADGSPVVFAGKTYRPRSRTFIPAKVEDNPAYMAQGYDAVLNALPEPLRSQLRYGDMAAARQDDAWQLIPTRWVVAAQRRWAARTGGVWDAAKAGPLTRVGQDVAMGGDDQTVTARLHGATLAPLVAKSGKDTPDGQSVVALLLGIDAPVNLDAIGVGKSAYDVARLAGMTNVRAIVVSTSTNYKDPKVRDLKFVNLRAAMMWHVRTLLDPEGGPEETRLALPPDRELAADLCAPRYALRAAGIQVESKDDIKKRIGRSTDRGDAAALACWDRGGVEVRFLGG